MDIHCERIVYFVMTLVIVKNVIKQMKSEDVYIFERYTQYNKFNN